MEESRHEYSAGAIDGLSNVDDEGKTTNQTVASWQSAMTLVLLGCRSMAIAAENKPTPVRVKVQAQAASTFTPMTIAPPQALTVTGRRIEPKTVGWW